MTILRPNKHSNPDKTVMYAAFVVLRKLRSSRLESLDKIGELVKTAIPGGGPLVLPALNLLFLLGLVEYRKKIDSIEYLGGK